MGNVNNKVPTLDLKTIQEKQSRLNSQSKVDNPELRRSLKASLLDSMPQKNPIRQTTNS
jgi:hypothetical protein